METEALGETKAARKLVFHRVAENLYRLEMSGGYYALVKRGGKQFRRSLKTKDRKLAERRLAEYQAQVGNLTLSEDARLSFDDLAKRWIETTRHTLKPSSVIRREKCVKGVAPFFQGMLIRNVQPQHCERWVKERGPDLAPQSFAHELNTMRGIFDYAVRLGIMLNNPARDIKRKRIVQAKIEIPTREQFKTLIETIRKSDGRDDSQRKAKAGADLIELLAYSGCRIAEATALRWRDVNFDTDTLTVSGGETGTKNHEARVIPMTNALRTHLEKLKADIQPTDDQHISHIASAKKCLETACKKLSYPKFSHHDFRHLFATTCIEAGVDIPTVSRWLGHKDGGALAMRVYGHLRQEHSFSAAKKVTF